MAGRTDVRGSWGRGNNGRGVEGGILRISGALGERLMRGLATGIRRRWRGGGDDTCARRILWKGWGIQRNFLSGPEASQAEFVMNAGDGAMPGWRFGQDQISDAQPARLPATCERI